MSDPLMELDGMEKYFTRSTGFISSLFGSNEYVKAVDGVSFTLEENQVVGVIGESGCGKTTLLKTLMGLYDPTGGEIRYKGTPLSSFSRADWKEFRRNVQIIFQDPFNSIDPKMSVQETLKEPLKIHGMDASEERILEVLEQVELNPASNYLNRLPQQLSGGEKQRVSIARALVTDPDIILADEPVSMLDVSTQASVLNLLSDLTTDLGVSMIYISHDLSTVGYVCDLIKVMYLGRVVESAPTQALLDDPKHPYTQELVAAVPIPDPHHARNRTSIEGAVADPIGMGSGCRFRDRCPERMDICETKPMTIACGEKREVACHLHYDHEQRVQAGADTTFENTAVTGQEGDD
ncbi:ABC transporter ATP-binding protein [Salinigranum halophilum]|uniref:ABC transporter ATP-binding protein n=1 Tax=Salinigranum halophilum TaxID=2565931 RepID=UPI0010A809AC|nr:ABC transporter ATP-binding protein [Salinigranum halophilum]